MKPILIISPLFLLAACSAPVDHVSGVSSDDLCTALQTGNVAENSTMIGDEEVTMDSVYGELTQRKINPYARGCFGSQEKAVEYRKHQEKIVSEALNY
ncbi:hypothetical protein J4N45_20325 [Vibrio sp. SCSIO 43140]|uniref:hypothetical protein n=1 Tax=Vibrio sp. SCSIO 43140 TaxID=2819100 RepID=UPI0020753F90|nr:hypothetical protein [Vibrio sp. SCSIO 43140]USD63338.1 hypothetical protein J4N45_20325 [Vibrio sp. SCSIO 43140]